MASFVYAVWSITNVASVHCAVRPEISPCTCEPIYAHNYVELSCEKVDSFHQIVDALSDKFEPFINISLKISHSQLEDLEMRSFTDMNLNVVKLRMQWNGLRSMPELPFRGLSNVEFLSVGDNELEEIPKHMLNHMPLIKTLDMGRCRIRSISQDDFKGVQNVNNLFMPSNNITRLEKGSFPPNLLTLHLGRNQIESLNGSLRDLNKLESLFINMNSISTLDDELPQSNILKLLIAQNNRLERLPESMRYMGNLDTMHLQYNRLKSFDGIFKNAKMLIQFYAYSNEIEYLAQDEFQSSHALEDLDLALNRIKSLNHSLLPLTRLYSANFSYNEIEEFSMNEIRGLMHLKLLDLSNNHIKKLTGRQENNIDQDSFLIEFNLNHNELKALDGALMGLNSLRILSLSYNQIERISPEDFIGLVKLEILELSHNQLLTLKEMERTYLPSLRILKAAYNNLTKLEKDFHGLPVLCQANLTNNQISSISTELVYFTRCKNHNVPGKLELHLDDNPIMCDERLGELCSFMLGQDTRIRGRSLCFDDDPEVCTALSMLYSDTVPRLIKQQLNPKTVPENPVVKMLPPSILIPSQMKNPEKLLPTVITPLGQSILKPLILTPPIPLTTTTLSPTTTTTTTSAAISVVEVPPHVNETDSNLTNFTTATSTATVPVAEIESTTASTPVTTTATSTTSTTTTTTTVETIATDTSNQDDKQQNESNYTTQTPLGIEPAPPEETQPLVIDIKEIISAAPKLQSEVTAPVAIDDGVIAIGGDSVAVAAPATQQQTEYATMEYIPNLDEFMSRNHQADVLEEDSNSNSVHQEFPSVVLANLDNAPQSLLSKSTIHLHRD